MNPCAPPAPAGSARFTLHMPSPRLRAGVAAAGGALSWLVPCGELATRMVTFPLHVKVNLDGISTMTKEGLHTHTELHENCTSFEVSDGSHNFVHVREIDEAHTHTPVINVRGDFGGEEGNVFAASLAASRVARHVHEQIGKGQVGVVGLYKLNSGDP